MEEHNTEDIEGVNESKVTTTMMMMRGYKNVYLAAFLIQPMLAGLNIFAKAVYNHGMNSHILVFYRQAAATAFLLPCAFYFEWKKAPRPPLSFKIFCQIFALSLFGITLGLNLFTMGLDYTSATLAAAAVNCTPAVTFVLAVTFRMEEWKIRTASGLAKLGGILASIGGALVLALYEGFLIKPPMTHHFDNHHHHHQQQQKQELIPDHSAASKSSSAYWIKGFLLTFSYSVLLSIFMLLQGPVLKRYPSKLLFSTLCCLCSSIQSFVVAIALERDSAAWKLGWDICLAAVLYCGISLMLVFYLQAYVIEKRGPVFFAMWMPLNFVISTTGSSLILGETISFGSILGGLFLVGSLYSVLWAKSKDAEECTPDTGINESDRKFQSQEIINKSSQEELH